MNDFEYSTYMRYSNQYPSRTHTGFRGRKITAKEYWLTVGMYFFKTVGVGLLAVLLIFLPAAMLTTETAGQVAYGAVLLVDLACITVGEVCRQERQR